jgi:hypothetical protein
MKHSRPSPTGLSTAGRLLISLGVACIAVTAVSFGGTLVYEALNPPTDMHLPGIISASLIVYVLPVGLMLALAGGVLTLLSILWR